MFLCSSRPSSSKGQSSLLRLSLADRMRKAGVPEDAVQQRIKLVVSPPAKIARYEIMLKVGVPEGAVGQRQWLDRSHSSFSVQLPFIKRSFHL